MKLALRSCSTACFCESKCELKQQVAVAVHGMCMWQCAWLPRRALQVSSEHLDGTADMGATAVSAWQCRRSHLRDSSAITGFRPSSPNRLSASSCLGMTAATRSALKAKLVLIR